MSKSTEVLYYNKTFFDANGLDPAHHLGRDGSSCATRSSKSIRTAIPLGYDSENNWFITMT